MCYHIRGTFYERNDKMGNRKNSSVKRSNKKSKLRYDRIAAAVILFAFVIYIPVFFHKISSGNGEKNNSKTDLSKTDSLSDNIINTTGRIEFEKKFFKADDIHKGELILVNDSHEYISPPEEESTLTSVDEIKNDYYRIKSMGMMMDTLAVKNFNSMMSGFYQVSPDKSIMVTNAFISKEHQDMMYNQALENSMTISKGGFSEHQTGLAVDISAYKDNGESFKYNPIDGYEWIRDNCTKYGFIRRYPEDKSKITGISGQGDHFRYVGIPHAYYMTENDLTLEEYTEQLKNYPYGSKTLSISCYSKEYEVYYIKAKYDATNDVDVYVPCTNSYTISGNNTDGFIITVEK